MRPMLAKTYDGKNPCLGWFWSQKRNGMRAIWDGTRFLSRYSNPIYAPPFFLPKTTLCLDGELDWLPGMEDRSREELFSTLKRQDYSGDWENVAFYVFEAPMKRLPPWQLYPWLESQLANLSRVFVIPQQRVTCVDRHLTYAAGLNWEGIMLRHPDMLYCAGVRSPYLLKVKLVSDCDCIVVGHNEGLGKYSGRLGSVVVRECGRDSTFSVSGMRDRDRDTSRYPIGSIVKVEYRGRSSYGVPQEARLVGEID